MTQQHLDNLSLQIKTLPEVDDKEYSGDLNKEKAEFSNLSVEAKSIEANLAKLKLKLDEVKNTRMEAQAGYKAKESQQRAEQKLIEGEFCPTCKQNTKNIKITVSSNSMDSLAEKVQELLAEEVRVKADIARSENALAECRGKGLALKDKIREIEDRIRMQSENAGTKYLRDNLKKQMQEATLKLIEVQGNLSTYEDLVYVYDLIKQCSGANGYIKERIGLFIKLFNRSLRLISVELLGEDFDLRVRKNDKGNFELTLNDGLVELPYSSLSSGTKARLDIVAHFALSEVVELLTGVSLNIIILDEVLATLDLEGVAAVEGMLGKIKAKYPDKLVFIVLHSDMLKGFDFVLEVERNNNSSKLSWK